MRITAKNKICMVIGDPIGHSISPTMHNAGYEVLEIDDQFIFIGANVKIENIENFIKGVRAMNIRGISCTIPHKIEVMKYLDEVDPIAHKIGAVNTIVNENGVLKGYNTDWLGIVIPLEKITSLKNKKIALIGAGGAARAVAYGMVERGASLTIYNRTFDKALTLAKETNSQAKNMEDISLVKEADIIINSTSIGMTPKIDETPVDKSCFRSGQIVFDIVYSPLKTRFLREAEEVGARIIYGTEMFLYQGMAQFEYYTGKKAPEEAMRAIINC